MIRINQLKLPVEHTEAELYAAAARDLKIAGDRITQLRIMKRSLDARKKPALYYVYQLDITVSGQEASVIRRARSRFVTKSEAHPYHFPASGSEALAHRPVIIGSGPAGLFGAYMLATHGYRPIVLERGKKAADRKADIDAFWKGAALHPDSNVQFGEGGAGTFSDGKLNTLIKDKDGRGRSVLSLFVAAGAPASILYEQKPHIGTDLLIRVITNIRKMTEDAGGTFLFESKVTDLDIEDGAIRGVTVGGKKRIGTDLVILAVGHSARDTFEMLSRKDLEMQCKSFAVGVRIEHPQQMIDLSQYGREAGDLGAASYKLTHQTGDGRGVYSFCMCPGGYVVNASSEPGHLVVNGMSYHGRNGKNANSAIITTVTPKDYEDYRREGEHEALSGIRFAAAIEESAYQALSGKIPVQRFADFIKGVPSLSFGDIAPCIKGDYGFADINAILPPAICAALQEGITAFGTKIAGFNCPDAVLSAPETRTSSPVRIPRNERQMSSISGLYPCGEGAGYAGGIVSAAIDGIKTAEAIAARYKPPE